MKGLGFVGGVLGNDDLRGELLVGVDLVVGVVLVGVNLPGAGFVGDLTGEVFAGVN